MASDTSNLAPEFIRFLFSSKPKFDFYFEVGNKLISSEKPERIGAVKLMLMAHSEVFRLELEDSDLKDKENVPIPDIHPDTFKGMLKYVYGHDTTPHMSFDEADNLLYVAEKYMMNTFKNKLATRLMKLLNADNICSLLNNPACYTHLQLDAAITDILRYETDRILVSPQFLYMNTDGFLKILQQNGLAVAEIDLWRAALKWAKHRANTEEGKKVREQLCGVTQHLRICSLTPDEIVTEVVTTEVLTDSEISAVMLSVGKKKKPQGWFEFSDEIEPREILKRKDQINRELTLNNLRITGWVTDAKYSMKLLTKKCSIELLPLICRSKYGNNMEPENWTYEVNCAATITEIANPHNGGRSPTYNPPTIVIFSLNVKCGAIFEIPLAIDGENVILQPDTKYSIEIYLIGDHIIYSDNFNRDYRNNHLVLSLEKTRPTEGNYFFPTPKLKYRVVT